MQEGGLAWHVERHCYMVHRLPSMPGSQSDKHPRVKVKPIQVPAARFTYVHVDSVGPLLTSSLPVHHGGRVDQMAGSSSSLQHGDITLCGGTGRYMGTRFGMPSLLTSDQGRQFF
jgi:hypothetical protein